MKFCNQTKWLLIVLISAVSQEVFASTQQAVELGEDTNQQAEKVRECMKELKETVSSIDKYM